MWNGVYDVAICIVDLFSLHIFERLMLSAIEVAVVALDDRLPLFRCGGTVWNLSVLVVSVPG